MDSLKGKVALVSGVSSGIGEAITEELVKHGMKVVGIARRSERLCALSAKLANEPGEFHGIKSDVTVEKDLLNVFDFIRKRFGIMHAIINNAGIARNSSLTDGSAKEWKEVFDTNVMGLCICTKEAVRLMKETGVDGYVIHINSIVGHAIPASLGSQLNVYPATKHAITALSEVLRLELIGSKSKIRVTSLSPGLVKTEIVGASNTNNITAEIIKDRPFLLSKDIAEAVVFLLSRPPHVEITEMIIKPQGEGW